MDSFQGYLKKQLLDYVEEERKKGIPLEQIEKVLTDAGHEKNIIDEVMDEIEAKSKTVAADPVQGDFIAKIKDAFAKFSAQAGKSEIKKTKEEIRQSSDKIVEDVIEEAEIIEEKNFLEYGAFFLYLVALGLIVLISASASGSSLVSVAIGFSPAILSVFISFLALGMAENVPVYVFIPLLITSAFYGIVRFSGMAFGKSLDAESLAVVNFMFALLFNVIVVYIKFIKPESLKKRIIKVKKEAKPTQEVPVKVAKAAAQEPKPERKEIIDLRKEFKI